MGLRTAAAGFAAISILGNATGAFHSARPAAVATVREAAPAPAEMGSAWHGAPLWPAACADGEAARPRFVPPPAWRLAANVLGL